MEVNDASSSIVQERPEYTNIENGIGIFSSRYNKDSFSTLFTITITIEITFFFIVIKSIAITFKERQTGRRGGKKEK